MIDVRTDHVATLVLAAGYSSRMQGAFKPLLKLGDATVVEHAITSHLHAGIQDVRVVVGYRADEVIDAVRLSGVSVVRNPNFDQGMFTSIQEGVATLEPSVKAFFIMPADIPWVYPTTIRTLLNTYTSSSCGILYPTYGGKRGHPPLISRTYIHEIMGSLAPDGLRGILKSHDGDACEVEVNDEGVLLDIDTPMDYHRLLHYRDGENIPSQAQCMALLEQAHVDEPVQAHCCMVASVACKLVDLLGNAGVNLNDNLVRAASLLHDIRRNEKNHASVGAVFLRASGYDQVADIVASHMDIEDRDNPIPTEAEIVYLADKFVIGKEYVPLEKRFAVAAARHDGDEKALSSIWRRRDRAEKIKKKVEHILGCNLEEIFPVKRENV
jgi:molybdenum cofactor cytidylyltransferase